MPRRGLRDGVRSADSGQQDEGTHGKRRTGKRRASEGADNTSETSTVEDRDSLVGRRFEEDGTVFEVHTTAWSSEHACMVVEYFEVVEDEEDYPGERIYHFSTLEEVKEWCHENENEDDDAWKEDDEEEDDDDDGTQQNPEGQSREVVSCLASSAAGPPRRESSVSTAGATTTPEADPLASDPAPKKTRKKLGKWAEKRRRDKLIDLSDVPKDLPPIPSETPGSYSRFKGVTKVTHPPTSSLPSSP